MDNFSILRTKFPSVNNCFTRHKTYELLAKETGKQHEFIIQSVK